MLFQKFTVLAALMVFASQGAIALPYPASDDSQGLTDNLTENAADLKISRAEIENIIGRAASSSKLAGCLLGGAGMLFQQFNTLVALMELARCGIGKKITWAPERIMKIARRLLGTKY
ncbi:hypothetical protein BYT27DRAFT_7263503 [Phlegmacium glaucopus]|nr:hypothetical protein BYT27DRAFT_7263503 [Phlegmacium glaucopus]